MDFFFAIFAIFHFFGGFWGLHTYMQAYALGLQPSFFDVIMSSTIAWYGYTQRVSILMTICQPYDLLALFQTSPRGLVILMYFFTLFPKRFLCMYFFALFPVYLSSYLFQSPTISLVGLSLVLFEYHQTLHCRSCRCFFLNSGFAICSWFLPSHVFQSFGISFQLFESSLLFRS